MQNSDIGAFSKMIDALHEYHQPNRSQPYSANAIKVFFAALKDYPIETIRIALSQLTKSKVSGKWMPVAAHIIETIEGPDPTADEIIALAKTHNTPLGVIALIQIGSYDLKNADGFKLKQRAHEVLIMLPEIKARSISGKYTPHELETMKKYGVPADRPLAFGIFVPQNKAKKLT